MQFSGQHQEESSVSRVCFLPDQVCLTLYMSFADVKSEILNYLSNVAF